MAEAGGYDLDFLDPPQEDHECPICQLVMREPQIVGCCGYKYCFGCINRILNANKPCPMCLSDSFNVMPEKQLQRKIKDLKVKCPQAKLGCDWKGEIRELTKHLEASCMHVEITCPLECGRTFLRESLQKHQEDECPKRTTELKFVSLVRKMEARLSCLEAKCSQQEDEISSLTEEMQQLKLDRDRQDEKLKALESGFEISSTSHEAQFQQTLRAIEGELIRRCISFPCRVSINDNWISPPFYSHHNGYVLQLSAGLQKFNSALDSLAYSLFTSGRNPEKGPVKLALSVLPQSNNEEALEWPIHVSVDLLVLTNTDGDSHTKMYTLTKYKNSQKDEKRISLRPISRSGSSDDEETGTVIGHARFCFSCRLLILNISYSPDPPIVEADSKHAVDDGKV